MSLEMLQPIAVELFVCGGALALLLTDMYLPDSARKHLSSLTALLLIAALYLTTRFDGGGAIGTVYVGSAFTQLCKRLLLSATLIAVLGGKDFVAKVASRRQGEYHFLILMCLSGMMMLPGARDLILLIVCFELMGIPLYILAAFIRDEETPERRLTATRQAAEAGLKLYLVGGASTTVTLFGLSLLVGGAGSTHLDALLAAPATPLHIVGMLMVLGGMGFKIGAVPFHMWVPDTYQGAPTPVVAFLSVAPKAAGMATLAVLSVKAIPSSIWQPALTVLAVVTMTVGNLMALPQRNVKRLLGYSGVAQIGYMLLSLCVGGSYALGMLLFYLCGYAVTNLGAFLVVHAVADGEGDDTLDGIAGLARRSPWLGMSLLMFLLSLAGIPFVVGFWAKLYIFMAAYQAGAGWLVIIGAVLAVVGLFYYLQVARAAYMVVPSKPQPLQVAPWLAVMIVVCLLLVAGLGAYPGPLIEACQQAADALVAGR